MRKCVTRERRRQDDIRVRRVTEDYGDEASKCAGKRGYPTRGHAECVAARCELKRNVVLRTYRCPYCGLWHLTHKAGDSSERL